MNVTPLHAAYPDFNRILSELRHADGHLRDVINNGGDKAAYTKATRRVDEYTKELLDYLRENHK